MIITTSTSNSGAGNIRHGPSLSASVLGFLGLSAIYPGGVEAFLGKTLGASRTAKWVRVGSVTCIFALTTNLLEEYRTQKNYFTGENDSHALIHHSRPARVDDLWNPVTGAFISGAVLQARQRSFMRILKGSAFFSFGMALYSVGLDWLDPIYPIKSLDLQQLATDFINTTTTGTPRK